MVWWERMMVVEDMAARNRSRRTGKDVLPYKSACVWCTAINLNDLSPLRACFGIQEPQQGLLACQGCSSFGLPPLWNSSSHWNLWLRERLTATRPLPAPFLRAWLSPSPSETNTSPNRSWDKKPHQAVRLLTTVLHSFPEHMWICSRLRTALPGFDSGVCCVSEKATPSASSHVVLVWPMQGMISQGKWVKETLWKNLFFYFCFTCTGHVFVSYLNGNQ